MTYYRRVWLNGQELDIDNYDNTLEGVALKLKKTRSEIEALNLAYERAQEHLASIMEKQKSASASYKELKSKLVELAEEIDDEQD